jgi:rhamnosyltransferase
MGLKVYVDNKIEMKHNMGEDGMDWFGVYKPIYRSPVRHYYIVRNTLAMFRIQYVPMRWKTQEFLKLIRRIIFYVIFSNNRVQTLKNIIQAFSDGLSGKMGVKN